MMTETPKLTASPWQTVKKILKPFASLKLTVALFAMSAFLVFMGTLAMMTKGLWTVVDEYFRSTYVMIPLDLFRKFGTVFMAESFPKDAKPWDGKFPFPGGWLLGTFLLINVTAAHLVRFKLTWKRSGIFITHAGVILLMLGELAAGLYAVEGTMTLNVGESSDFVDVTQVMEIAVCDESDATVNKTTVIPHRLFKKPGKVQSDELPFDVEVLEYWRNTVMKEFNNNPELPHSYRLAPEVWLAFTRTEEAAGVDTEARSDYPSALLKLTDKVTGADLGTHFVSLWFYTNSELNRRRINIPPPTITVNNKPYTLLLRHKRLYKPYTVKLLKFEHGKYPGTDIPKDFASTIDFTENSNNDTREVRVWMNNPFRFEQDSLFQHAVVGQDDGSILQVVENRFREMPYYSCGLVSLGMLVHFGMRLSNFMRKAVIA